MGQGINWSISTHKQTGTSSAGHQWTTSPQPLKRALIVPTLQNEETEVRLYLRRPNMAEPRPVCLGPSLGVVSASAIPGRWSWDGLGRPSTQVSLWLEGLWPQVALIDSEWEV